jgi:hypothetical protein
LPCFEYEDSYHPDASSPPECTQCDVLTEGGQEFVHWRHQWIHVGCFMRMLTEVSPRRAWMVLAEQMMRAPSRYSAAEIRAVLLNLIRIAGAS